MPFPPEYGGGGFPWLVGVAMQEELTSANMGFSLCPLLTQGAIDMLLHHGSEAQREVYLPQDGDGRVDGHDEPHRAPGRLRRRRPARRGPCPPTTGRGGSPARRSSSPTASTTSPTTSSTSCWPACPTRRRARAGISCFIVPKFLVNDDGSLGERNAVECVSIEHKMGINASPTCVMAYDGAVGYLIGEPNQGMRYMFTMMNNARLSVGVEGLAIAERAYQQARRLRPRASPGAGAGSAGGRVARSSITPTCAGCC